MSLVAEDLQIPKKVAVRPNRVVVLERHRGRLVLLMLLVAALLLFAASSVRHYVLRSGAFDLGFFDQAVWLISQGQTPISSLHRFHVLADHGSLILYPVAILYLVLPDPHTLLALQAIALAGGAWPIWKLARRAGLYLNQCYAIVAAYLMYPLLLTTNIFDFHPDVLAVPALLMAILSAKEQRKFRFCFWILLALCCKEILSLTVAAMGVWLLISDRKKPFYGMAALVGGAVWFVFATKFLIPHFGAGRTPSGIEYYNYLGNSVGQIMMTMLLRPGVVLAKILSLDAAQYILLLAAPLIWGLHRRTLAPLIAAIPAVALNLLSINAAQRSPFFQYSLPIIPFIFMAVILALAADVAWLRNAKAIVAWSIMLLVVGIASRAGKFESAHATDWNTLRHTKEAIRRITPEARVLTTFETVPQLSQREVVEYIGGVCPLRPLPEYDYILLSLRHSSLESRDSEVTRILATATVSPAFSLEYAGPDVFLFRRNPSSALVATLYTN